MRLNSLMKFAFFMLIVYLWNSLPLSKLFVYVVVSHPLSTEEAPNAKQEQVICPPHVTRAPHNEN